MDQEFQKEDELNFITLLLMMFRIKWFLLGGGLLGVLLGMVLFYVYPAKYQISLPLIIGHEQKESFMKDPKKRLETFNEAFFSTPVVYTFFEKILEKNSIFAQNAKEKSFTVENLTSLQSDIDPQARKTKSLISFHENGPQEFVLKTTLPLRGLLQKNPQMIVDALNQSIEEYNHLLFKAAHKAAQNRVMETEKALLNHEKNIISSQKSQISEFLNYRTELSILEYQLYQKVAWTDQKRLFLTLEQGSTSEEMVTKDKKKNTEDPIELSLQRILRLKSILTQENILTENDIIEIDTTISKVLVTLKNNKQLQTSLESENTIYTQYSQARQLLSNPLDPQEMYLPLLTLDEKMASYIATSPKEKEKYSQILFQIAGGFLGLFGGILLGLLFMEYKRFKKLYSKAKHMIKNPEKKVLS